MIEKKQGGIFYGWVIVGVALLSLVVSNGLSLLGIPVFYKFIQNDLVATGNVAANKIQSVFGVAPALTSLLAGLFAPVGGVLLQKFNVRRMMLIGCGILGAGLLIYSQANSTILVYLAHALMGASLGFVGVLTSTVLVSNWFRKKRGAALGIVLTGTSFGGVLIPQIATPLIQSYGWRTAMILVSLTIWVILFPAIIFLVKNRPSDIGLLPDGEISINGGTVEEAIKETSNEGMSLNEALGTPVFWIFSLCAALIFYIILVVSQQLNLYLQTPKIGFTAQQASNVQSLIFALAIMGKFLFGWLSDHFQTSRIMLVSATTMFLATLCFLYFNSTTIYFFAVFFGLNYGGTFVLLQLLVVEYFGLKEYGKILGTVTVIETVGGGIGTLITGRIADAYGGDFTQGFYGITIISALVLMTVTSLNLLKKKSRYSGRALPIIFTPIVGALVGIVAAPVFTEVFRIIFGLEISLVIPLIIICLISGLILGISASRKLKVKSDNEFSLDT